MSLFKPKRYEARDGSGKLSYTKAEIKKLVPGIRIMVESRDFITGKIFQRYVIITRRDNLGLWYTVNIGGFPLSQCYSFVTYLKEWIAYPAELQEDNPDFE